MTEQPTPEKRATQILRIFETNILERTTDHVPSWSHNDVKAVKQEIADAIREAEQAARREALHDALMLLRDHTEDAQPANQRGNRMARAVVVKLAKLQDEVEAMLEGTNDK